jgi:hypothetical protein
MGGLWQYEFQDCFMSSRGGLRWREGVWSVYLFEVQQGPREQLHGASFFPVGHLLVATSAKKKKKKIWYDSTVVEPVGLGERVGVGLGAAGSQVDTGSAVERQSITLKPGAD